MNFNLKTLFFLVTITAIIAVTFKVIYETNHQLGIRYKEISAPFERIADSEADRAADPQPRQSESSTDFAKETEAPEGSIQWAPYSTSKQSQYLDNDFPVLVFANPEFSNESQVWLKEIDCSLVRKTISKSGAKLMLLEYTDPDRKDVAEFFAEIGASPLGPAVKVYEPDGNTRTFFWGADVNAELARYLDQINQPTSTKD